MTEPDPPVTAVPIKTEKELSSSAWGKRDDARWGAALLRLWGQARGSDLPKMRKVEKTEHSTAQADMLMRAANHHLTRVGLLADTEWKVSLAFWTGLVLSGAALLSVAATGSLEITYLIYRYSGFVLVAYLYAAALFTYGFSVNQSQSINTERNRFLYYENAALYSVGVDDEQSHIDVKTTPGIKPLSTVSRSQSRLSSVWTMKLLSTTGFILSAWGAAVTVAGLRTTLPLAAGVDRIAAANLVGALIMWISWIGLSTLFFMRAQRAAR